MRRREVGGRDAAIDPGAVLAAAIEEAIPGWVERSVARVLAARGMVAGDAVGRDAGEAGRRAATEVGDAVRRLLATDIDAQATTPLALLRGAVRYPTAVLRRAGVTPVERDEFARRHFPDDDYDLTPASFGDVDPSLVEPGIVWGASKARAHLERHRSRP